MSKPQWHLSRIGAHPPSETMPEGMGRHEGEACWLTQSAPACATRPWPADRVEHWPIERLIAYANKPRLHSDSDLDKIVAGSPDRDRSGSADG